MAPLLEQGAARRRRGRARLRPNPIRRHLHRRGIGSVIPRQRGEPRRGVRFHRWAYRERNRIERTINRLNQYRAIVTHYEKLAATFHALLTLATTKLFYPPL